MEHLPHSALMPPLTAGPRAAGPPPACSQGLMGQQCCMDLLRSSQLGGSEGLTSCTPAALGPGLLGNAAVSYGPSSLLFAGSLPGIAEGAALELTCHRKSGTISNQNRKPFQTSQVRSTLSSHESSRLPQFYKADSVTPIL